MISDEGALTKRSVVDKPQESETPETDSIERFEGYDSEDPTFMRNHARDLERRLRKAEERYEDANEARHIAMDQSAADCKLLYDAQADLEASRAELAKATASFATVNAEIIESRTLTESLLESERQARREAEEALEKIEQWSHAYPLDVFPEPDLVRAAAILKNFDMTLDSISAWAMRHVVTEVGNMARAALSQSAATEQAE